MIQRIQSLYLFIAVVCLMVAQFGASFFYIIGEKLYYLNAYGLFENTASNELELIKNIPFFLFPIVLIILLVITTFSYKSLKKQLRLMNIVTIVYSIFVLTLLALFFSKYNFTNDKMNLSYQFGPAIYFVIIGYPALFMATKGIKKDKKTLDSLNRLR